MLILYKLFGTKNLTQNFRFGKIWSHDPNTILFFLKFGVKSRGNTLTLIILFTNDDLVQKFGPTIKLQFCLTSLTLRTNGIF